MSEMKISQVIADSVCEMLDCEIIASYSGRGMYGATCLAFTGNSINGVRLGVALARAIVLHGGDDVDLRLHNLCEFSWESDNMGRGSVYYCRSLKLDAVCAVCGEPADDYMAEMYSDTDEYGWGTVICHSECGLARGLEVA